MKYFVVFLLTVITSCMNKSNHSDSVSFYDFTCKTIDGKDFNMSSLKGKKVMIVNVASMCGLTPQYEQLEQLYSAYKDNDFEILGFPSSDFANQEFSNDEQISAFCSTTYGVSFTIFEKIKVRGKSKHPLYQWLTEKSKNGMKSVPVLWNFQKFIIDKEGNLVDYFLPTTSPQSDKIIRWINN
ncbi:glutathione peroxidase [Flavobacteriales bacterium]|nr:glutathione peroxidase [Flavobacteriales bacterium]